MAKDKATPPLVLEIEREDDGRWIAEFPHCPGCLVYGETRLSAIVKAAVLLEKIEDATPPHECETPVDGSIQHRWKCKKCGKLWEVVAFDASGNSVYEEVEVEGGTR